jgi:hypothetical protein
MPGRGDNSANPRFVVTSLKADALQAQPLYEQLYCARGSPPRSADRVSFGDRIAALLLRDGKPDQGVPARSFRRSSGSPRSPLRGVAAPAPRPCGPIDGQEAIDPISGGDAASRPRRAIAPLARLDGLRAAHGTPPHRPRPHRTGPGHLRHDPPQAAEDRRRRYQERSPHQDRPFRACWPCLIRIGIGRSLAAPPSHTTGHTGPYHGGSLD